MFLHVNNCCNKTIEEIPSYTRPPCGREILKECGTPFKNTILDEIWGKPVWLRPIIQDIIPGITRPAFSPIQMEEWIRNGGFTFDVNKADPAFEWDHKDPFSIWSTWDGKSYIDTEEGPRPLVPNVGNVSVEWPASENIVASETDTGICDNKYYKLITHYPSVGRPFQTGTLSAKSQGLMISNIVPDIFPGKQVESFNYTTSVGNLIVKEISHSKREHENTAYPGDYWISWWNSINPGNIIGYKGKDIFNARIANNLSNRIRCDSNAGDSCKQAGCEGITLLDNPNKKQKVIKVSSGKYHSCVLLDNARCDCFGLTLSYDAYEAPLSVPDQYKTEQFMDINCGLNFTIGTLASGKLVGWGANNSGGLFIPSEFSVPNNHIKKLSVGGGHCVALLNGGFTLGIADGIPRNTSAEGTIEIWGAGGYKGRLHKRPRIATKEFKIPNTNITLRKGFIIPFWGHREQCHDAVIAYENSVDEYGFTPDPVSLEIQFKDIWAGHSHIVGLAKTKVYIEFKDLCFRNDDGNYIDPYTGFNYGSDPPFPDKAVDIFAWGNGMPGDPYNVTLNGELLVRQANPNYLSNHNVLSCAQGINEIPANWIASNFSDPQEHDVFNVYYDDNFYDIQNTRFIATSPTANHTVFVRQKWRNWCNISDTNGNPLSNGDPGWCPVPNSPWGIACPYGDIPNNNCSCEGYTVPLQYGGRLPPALKGIYWSCCSPGNGESTECCNQDYYGIAFDGWGDDRKEQITQLGLRDNSRYFDTPLLNKHFDIIDPYTFKSNKEYVVKCAVGSDRTVASLTVYKRPDEITSGEFPIESKIYSAGNSTQCISQIYDIDTKIDHLSCGYSHNVVVQDVGQNIKIDFPYKEEIDKSSNFSFQSTDTTNNPGATPRIILNNMGNTAEWHQPIFDLNSSSRLLFDLDVKIQKYKKIKDSEDKLISSLEFKVNKDSEKQSNGISVNLVGTRGDQRIKPFTGATCDCVWSDYATDNFKLAGHQGTILNHVGYDSNRNIRKTDRAWSWMEFNQLRGSGSGGGAPGGHEQPWRNFETITNEHLFKDYKTYFSLQIPKLILDENGNQIGTEIISQYAPWQPNPNKPKINYWYAPPNSFTHNIIEIPPGRFPSELSYHCRNKYCYGGNNNIIRNWCDPCFKGVTSPKGINTGWMGRLGCTGCEFNYNDDLCTGCTFNDFGVWECPDTAPPIRDVYGYECSANVFGGVIPDEIIIKTTSIDEVKQINPHLKNKPVYQKEIRIDPETEEETIIWWYVGDVTTIKRRAFTFIPYEGPEDETELKRELIRSESIYFKNITGIYLSEDGPLDFEFKNYDYKKYSSCSEYNLLLNKYNSFGELSTPIEESWPSLNRYFIPRWASLNEDDNINSWSIKENQGTPIQISGYTEVDYPLVVVPAHGGDIGAKYNMEGYTDTSLWGFFSDNYKNTFFYTEILPEWVDALQWFKPPPKYSSNFYPGLGKFANHFKSRYVKDSVDFEYPFNKHINVLKEGSLAAQAGYFPEFRPNEKYIIEFTNPPPGVFFSSQDIKYQNFKQNGINKVEPLCGDTETGCSSCSIPFTGAKISAWGFDLLNDAVVSAVQKITGLNGDLIKDIEFGNIKINSEGKNGVWLGIAKDRFNSIKRLRIMVPIDLEPGETIMFGRGVVLDNYSETHINGDYYYTLTVKGKFDQYPNDTSTTKTAQTKPNYQYRWGRFNDECACNSRISLDDLNAIDITDIPNGSVKELIQKYQNGSPLTDQEKTKLITGDVSTGGFALVKFANCENPHTYLEAGESPKLTVSAQGQSMEIGLSDMSDLWPIWNKTMCGNGYNCMNMGTSSHIGDNGYDILNPILSLYTGRGPRTATTWFAVRVAQFTPDFCIPSHSLSGSGVRGFWSDWLSNRGYSNFFTSNTANLDDDKDRVGGDIPFEASHPQGWLGAGFVNPTDGFVNTVEGYGYGGDSIGDILGGVLVSSSDFANHTDVIKEQFFQGYGEYLFNSLSGKSISLYSFYKYLQYNKKDMTSNFEANPYDEINLQKPPFHRPFDTSDTSEEGLMGPFPRTQNKKAQILKACCFGDHYLNETPSSVTNSILPDRYTYNVKRNKYRNLYNAKYHSHSIDSGSHNNKIVFRKWHGDPFNPIDYDTRLRGLTPVWADYWYAEEFHRYCPDGYEWLRNIQNWRHRRWQLPLFFGVNKDNLASFFINDPTTEDGQRCTPETCSGLELIDTSFSNVWGAYKFGWNHRKYDSVTSHHRLSPGSLKWISSFRGANSSSFPNTVQPPRGCACLSYASTPPKTATMYSLNNAIWYNCVFGAEFPDIFGNDVNFSIDYSRWNPYFQYLGPGFIDASVTQANGGKILDATITNSSWY